MRAAVIVPTVFFPSRTVNPIMANKEIFMVKLVKKEAVDDCIPIIVDSFTCIKIYFKIFLNL